MSRHRAAHASKFLSLVLRHRPEAAGVILDREGWIRIDELLAGCAAHGVRITRAELMEIVRESDKLRFALKGELIRANQGHSIDVDLALSPTQPPSTLFHGTVERFVASIRREGLVRGRRTHVHLSLDLETARRVALRRGDPVVLAVDAASMAVADMLFYRAENGVWLTDCVPPRFLTFPP